MLFIVKKYNPSDKEKLENSDVEKLAYMSIIQTYFILKFPSISFYYFFYA